MASKPSLGKLSLLNTNIDQLSAGLASGDFSSAELVTAYLARINEASKFKAVLQVNPDAIRVAQDLDNERAKGQVRGPLHGIPILVKDNIATKNRLDVSAGSFALLGAKPLHESSVVAKLRKAEVIVLGKTNSSEWANFRGLHITGGWSPRGGQTLGIYYPNSSPEGSSAGSAVAASLGLCAAALGTETFGSITEPAEFNNVVGLKATRGLDGAIPISRRQDVIGTLTTSVKDAAHMLTVMAGRSERDERTWNIPVDLTGIAIGIPRNTFPSDGPVALMESFEAALETFAAAGAKIVENTNFSAVDEFRELNQQARDIVRSSEFKRDIIAYLETLETNPNNIHSVEDIIEFMKTFPAEQYPKRDIGKFLWTQEVGIDVESDLYKHMVQQERYFGGEGGVLGAMSKFNVDVLAIPSSLGIGNDLAAKMGFPVLSLPLGFWPAGTAIEMKGDLVQVAPGMPYSLVLITKAFAEDKLLRTAYTFEQLTQVRANGPEPIFIPTTELKDEAPKI